MSFNPDNFVFDPATVDILCEHLKISSFLFPVEIPSVGATQDQRREIGARVWQDLERSGCVRCGRIEAEIESALRMASRPDMMVTALAVLDGGRIVRARAVSNGQAAWIIAQDGDGDPVRFTYHSANRVLGIAVDLIGVNCPAPGTPVTIPLLADQPVGQARTVNLGEDEDFEITRALDFHDRERRRAAEGVWQEKRIRAGSFTAHITDANGHDRISPELDWFDTAHGRRIVHQGVSPSGARTLTCVPGDNVVIHHYLDRYLRNLLDGR